MSQLNSVSLYSTTCSYHTLLLFVNLFIFIAVIFSDIIVGTSIFFID